MRRPVHALLLTAPLLLPVAACAQVYQWQDASGTAHFTETPPPAGTKYKQINTHTGLASTGSASAPASPNPNHAGGSSQPAPASTAAMADTPANRSKLCDSLDANLKLLKGSGPVVIQQNSEQKVLEGDDRQAQISAANAQYKQYCSNR